MVLFGMSEKQPLSVREIADRINANRQRMMLDPEQRIKDYEERVAKIEENEIKQRKARKALIGHRTIG